MHSMGAKVDEGKGAHQARDSRVMLERHQRPNGVGLSPVKGSALGFRQGFRQDKDTIEPIDDGKPCSRKKWNSRTNFTQYTTDHWSNDEPHTKGHTDQPKVLCPLLLAADICDVSCTC